MKPTNSTKRYKSDLARLEKMSDAAIDRSEIPDLDADFFRRAKLRLPEPKAAISMRLDRDLLKWFKAQGQGYQTRMNAVLRLYAEQHGLRHSAR